ncbi:MAG: ribonuclease HII [Candidatus Omnitrophota bacterium]
MWQFEEELFNKGIADIAGVDEAGRGPLAGPVVAAAVIIPRGFKFKQKIKDSKKLSAAQREKAFLEIKDNCCVAFSVISEQDIDRVNILQASLLAMAQAVKALSKIPKWVLIDGNQKPDISLPCTTIIAGDAKSISIACASIIAKVTRDKMMIEYDKLYPEYGFAGHKGYGTEFHRQAILKYGPCPIHRKTFEPIKSMPEFKKSG